MKKKQNIEEFLPRNERVKKIKIPQSTEGCLIIPPNNEGLGFRFDCFDSKILGGRVSKERFIQTVYTATKICGNVWSFKKKEEQKDPLRTEKMQIQQLWLLFIIGIILFLVAAYGQNVESDYYAIAGTVIIGFSSIVQLIIAIKSQFKQPQLINLEQSCREKLKSYLSDENEEYNKMGLNWVIGEDLFWLELYIMQGKLRNQ